MGVAIAVLLALLAGCYSSTRATCAATCAQDSDCTPLLGEAATCSQGLCAGEGQTCDNLPGDGGTSDGPSPGMAVQGFAVGGAFACAIDTQQHLACWGANSHHVVTSEDVPSSATLQPQMGVWTQISAGQAHACGLQGSGADAVGMCWGGNGSGECATGDPSDVSAPSVVPLQPEGPWKKLVAGSEHSCGLAGTVIYCWGGNTGGELGNGPLGGGSVPTAVESELAWSDVAAGPMETCGITTGGALYCWGDMIGAQGRLGNGSGGGSLFPVAVDVSTNADPWVEVSIGREAVCARTQSGALSCWGDNSDGAVGPNAVGVASSPVPNTFGFVVEHVSTAGSESCAVGAGNLVCWGTATAGGLGNGVWSMTGAGNTPTIATGSASAIAVGDSEFIDAQDGSDPLDPADLACTTVDDKLTCWGANQFGQLGTGHPGRLATPTLIPNLATNGLVAGRDHTCALVGSDAVCWGTTQLGQATGIASGLVAQPCSPANPCDVDAPAPLSPPVLTGSGSHQLAAGADHSCALDGDQVTCWGTNRGDALGLGSASVATRNTFTDTTNASGLIAAGDVTCGTLSTGSGTSSCWGDLVLAGLKPTEVGTATYQSTVQLSSNLATNALVQADGKVEWNGDNGEGQFGIGNEVSASGTTENPGPYTQVAVGGDSFACGVTGGSSSSLIKCWGSNASGGNPSGPDATADTVQSAGGGMTSCMDIAAGRSHACAVCANHALYCWGDDTLGQLGLGEGKPGIAPTAVLPPVPIGWGAVVAGDTFTCGRLTDGEVACWGDGLHGELGNGGGGATYPGERFVQPP